VVRVRAEPSALPVEIDPAKPGDYGSRANVPADTLILHTTEGGSIEGATTWWDREEVIASSHYVIDGSRVVQRVPEGFAAYAAGNREFNRRSVQIEVVGHAGRASTWTPEILAQLVALSAEVCKRHGIPVHHGSPGILGHCDVPNPRDPRRRGGANGHTDPGPHFPWQDFLDSVRAEIANEPLPPAAVQ
jgi:N-acetyl-anhydromuramyl-L-alanine amidase AmpD